MRVKIAALNDAEFKIFFRRSLVVLDKSQTEGYQFRTARPGEEVVQASISTECHIVSFPDRKEIARGVSVCDTRDQFNKSDGRRRALTHALKNFDESSYKLDEFVSHIDRFKEIQPLLKRIHAEIWNAYFKEMDKDIRKSRDLANAEH